MKKESALSWLYNKIKKRIPALMLMTASNVGTAFLGVMFALGTKNVINSAVSGSKSELIRAAVLQLLIIAGILLFSTLFRFLHARLAALMDMDWKHKLGDEILHSDYSRISKYHSGELLNFLNNDARIINDGLLATIPGFAGMVTKLISVVIVLMTLEPVFTLILLALGILVCIATGIARHYLKNMNKAVSASEGRVSAFFQEAFEKLIVVRSRNVEDEVVRRGEKVMQERYALQKKRMAVSVTANSSISALGYLTGFAALVWCAFRLSSGIMTFGELTAVTQLAAQLQAPFVNLSGVIPRYIAMSSAAERLMELENCCVTEACGNEETEADLTGLKSIEAENVSFAYDREEVFKKCSFSVPAGSFTVITGPSGIGKSTVLKLMLGIFKPSDGMIELKTTEGDIPVSLETRKAFAYVPQGNLLFSGTVRDNLILTNPEASEEQISEAVRVSCMDKFLHELPQGLETVLGENAQGLSEGQAQRLSIARAVLSGAPVILLDEATSALDADTEKQVLENIKALPGRTCIAVTHRPAAAEMADMQLRFVQHRIESEIKKHC